MPPPSTSIRISRSSKIPLKFVASKLKLRWLAPRTTIARLRESVIHHLRRGEKGASAVEVEVEDYGVRQWMWVGQVEAVGRAEVICRFVTAATVLDTKQMFALTTQPIGVRIQI